MAALFDIATLLACASMHVVHAVTRLPKGCETKGDVVVTKGWHASDEQKRSRDCHYIHDVIMGLAALFDFATLLAC